jgi:hypothetical protein
MQPLFRFFPVVPLADSLNHGLMDWQASGLRGSQRETEFREEQVAFPNGIWERGVRGFLGLGWWHSSR